MVKQCILAPRSIVWEVMTFLSQKLMISDSGESIEFGLSLKYSDDNYFVMTADGRTAYFLLTDPLVMGDIFINEI